MLNKRDKKLAKFLGSSTLFRIKPSMNTLDGGWLLFHRLDTRVNPVGEVVECRQTVRLLPGNYILLLSYELAYLDLVKTQRERDAKSLVHHCQINILYEEKVYEHVTLHKGSVFRTFEPITLEKI